MHILVSGGTGFIGSALVRRLLDNDHQLTVISRSPNKVFEEYQGKAAGCTIDDLPRTFDAVVNLAGATLDRRWTESYKRVIVDSRLETTNRLREAAEKAGAQVFVSGSAVGYYGDRGDEELDESASSGEGFLADLCVKWEQAAQSDRYRLAIVRTGVVVHRSGGALEAMLPFFKWFLGGRLGSGRQYWSWIHLDDIARMFAWALENEKVEGVLNGGAPEPVTNREFTRVLASAVHRPVSLPVPKFALSLLYGEMADMLLDSQRMVPKRPQELGFSFQFPQLKPALQDALSS